MGSILPRMAEYMSRARVCGHRRRLRETAGDLDAPGRQQRRVGELYRFRAANGGNLLETGQLGVDRAIGPCRGRGVAGPVLDGMACDDRNVVPRLGRQIAAAGEPVRDAGGTAIVSRGGQSEIAETLLELGEKLGGFRDRFLGIERIAQATFVGGPRHELRDALRAGRTGDAGLKAAFLPYRP